MTVIAIYCHLYESEVNFSLYPHAIFFLNVGPFLDFWMRFRLDGSMFGVRMVMICFQLYPHSVSNILGNSVFYRKLGILCFHLAYKFPRKEVHDVQRLFCRLLFSHNPCSRSICFRYQIGGGNISYICVNLPKLAKGGTLPAMPTPPPQQGLF